MENLIIKNGGDGEIFQILVIDLYAFLELNPKMIFLFNHHGSMFYKSSNSKLKKKRKFGTIKNKIDVKLFYLIYFNLLLIIYPFFYLIQSTLTAHGSDKERREKGVKF